VNPVEDRTPFRLWVGTTQSNKRLKRQASSKNAQEERETHIENAQDGDSDAKRGMRLVRQFRHLKECTLYNQTLDSISNILCCRPCGEWKLGWIQPQCTLV
jgi:hypothetical protein